MCLKSMPVVDQVLIARTSNEASRGWTVGSDSYITSMFAPGLKFLIPHMHTMNLCKINSIEMLEGHTFEAVELSSRWPTVQQANLL